jgi:D-threo-aldose 1-dehydrogenase
MMTAMFFRSQIGTGARTVAELEQNVAMIQHPIPADLWAELKAEGLLPAEAPTPAGAG